MMKSVIATVLFVACGFSLHAQESNVQQKAAAQEEIYKGNQLYKSKDYKGASAAYDRALKHEPASQKGKYNAGNAQYNVGDYEKAQQQFASAAEASKDKNEKARAYHNLGNSFMKKDKWKEAADAFKESLKLNPNDKDTRYNLAYALEKLKNQDKNKDKNKDKKDDKDKKDQDKKDQDKNKPDDKKDEDKKDKGDEKKDDKGKDKPEQQQPQSAPSKLSEKQAENLLNALRAEEKRIQDKKNQQKGVPVRVQKDW